MDNISLTEKETYLIDTLNKMLDTLKPITYGEFNKIFPAENVAKLRELEKEIPELGLARYGKYDEGVSSISIIATITEILCGRQLRLAIELEQPLDNVDDPKEYDYSNCLIIGFRFSCWNYEKNLPVEVLKYKEQ